MEGHVTASLGKDIKQVLKETDVDLVKVVAVMCGLDVKTVARRLADAGFVGKEEKTKVQPRGWAVPVENVGVDWVIVKGLAVKRDLVFAFGRGEWEKRVDSSNSCCVVWVLGAGATQDAANRTLEHIVKTAKKLRVIQFEAQLQKNAELLECPYTDNSSDLGVWQRSLAEHHRLAAGNGTTLIVVGALPELLNNAEEIIVIPDVLPDDFRHFAIEDLLEQLALDLRRLVHKKRKPVTREEFMGILFGKNEKAKGTLLFWGLLPPSITPEVVESWMEANPHLFSDEVKKKLVAEPALPKTNNAKVPSAVPNSANHGDGGEPVGKQHKSGVVFGDKVVLGADTVEDAWASLVKNLDASQERARMELFQSVVKSHTLEEALQKLQNAAIVTVLPKDIQELHRVLILGQSFSGGSTFKSPDTSSGRVVGAAAEAMGIPFMAVNAAMFNCDSSKVVHCATCPLHNPNAQQFVELDDEWDELQPPKCPRECLERWWEFVQRNAFQVAMVCLLIARFGSGAPLVLPLGRVAESVCTAAIEQLRQFNATTNQPVSLPSIPSVELCHPMAPRWYTSLLQLLKAIRNWYKGFLEVAKLLHGKNAPVVDQDAFEAQLARESPYWSKVALLKQIQAKNVSAVAKADALLGQIAGSVRVCLGYDENAPLDLTKPLVDVSVRRALQKATEPRRQAEAAEAAAAAAAAAPKSSWSNSTSTGPPASASAGGATCDLDSRQERYQMGSRAFSYAKVRFFSFFSFYLLMFRC